MFDGALGKSRLSNKDSSQAVFRISIVRLDPQCLLKLGYRFVGSTGLLFQSTSQVVMIFRRGAELLEFKDCPVLGDGLIEVTLPLQNRSKVSEGYSTVRILSNGRPPKGLVVRKLVALLM